MNDRMLGRAVTWVLASILLACSQGGSPTEVDSRPPGRIALAADGRFDLADAHVEKAIALVKAAQNPTAKDPKRPFGGHDTKAVSHLERARQEIAAAKAYADDPKNQTP